LKKIKQDVLLHACCAICSAYPIELLKELGYEPSVYFFNPNIFPEAEYHKRLDAQKSLCDKLACSLIVEEYVPNEYKNVAVGLENEPEKGKRCEKCFELRLLKTAKKAKELGIENFATSITISPHKNFELISKLGKTISQEYDINYLDIDFKKKDGFLKSNNMAKDFKLYRQNYCGCEYSIR
jgi:predicted adenine nucleotide alpha hydrolase (AANH) superfamily ATPase